MKHLTLKKVKHVSFFEKQPHFSKFCGENHYLITLMHTEKFAIFYGKTLIGVIGIEDKSFKTSYFSLDKVENISFAK